MIKKILLFIFIIFFTTSCYDYKEINKLTIVNAIGIDFKIDKYIITLETLESSKEDEPSSKVTTGDGITIEEAINKILLSLEKEPYYSHLKIVILTEDAANKKMKEITDYFLRNYQIRNIFSLVISDDSSPEELLLTKNKDYPVAGERIKNIIDNNNYSGYIAKNKYFKNIVSNYLSKNKNLAISMIKKDGKEDLKISKLALFDNKNIKTYLNEDEEIILSLVESKNPNSTIKIKCDNDKYVSFNIYKSKSKKKVSKDKFKIDLKLYAEIVSDNCETKFENNEEQKKIEKKLESEIKNDAKDLITKLKDNNTDVMGINKKFYNKYRYKNNKYFSKTNFDVNTEVKINKKGLIFGINNDK